VEDYRNFRATEKGKGNGKDKGARKRTRRENCRKRVVTNLAVRDIYSQMALTNRYEQMTLTFTSKPAYQLHMIQET